MHQTKAKEIGYGRCYWDSVKVHNRIVGVFSNGYGYLSRNTFLRNTYCRGRFKAMWISPWKFKRHHEELWAEALASGSRTGFQLSGLPQDGRPTYMITGD